MKLWLPVAVIVLVILVLSFFYTLSAVEPQGATSFDLTNSVGLMVVVVGVIVAAFVIRRGSPPK